MILLTSRNYSKNEYLYNKIIKAKITFHILYRTLSNSSNISSQISLNSKNRMKRLRHPLYDYKNEVLFARKVHTFWEYMYKMKCRFNAIKYFNMTVCCHQKLMLYNVRNNFSIDSCTIKKGKIKFCINSKSFLTLDNSFDICFILLSNHQ